MTLCPVMAAAAAGRQRQVSNGCMTRIGAWSPIIWNVPPRPKLPSSPKPPAVFHAGGSSSRRGKTWLAERGVGRARQGWRRGGSRWDGFG